MNDMMEQSICQNTGQNAGNSTGTGMILERVALSVGSRYLIRDLNMHIRPGECAAILGRSGAGKSSLLAWITGTLPPELKASGNLCINGRDLGSLPPEKRRIGILFQDSLLFPHLSVGQNLAFAIPASLPRKHRAELIRQALEDAGLPGYEHHDPATLSGGEKARVALMRMLLSRPDALLLDEPFSGLDPETRQSIRSFVGAHIRTHNLPALLVSHHQEDLEISRYSINI